MKQRLPLSVATAFLVAAGWAASASACDHKDQGAAASAKSAAYTAEMAAQCTAAQAAACKAKGASVTAAQVAACKAKGASAAAASCAHNHGNSATAAILDASAASCPHAHGASAAAAPGACPYAGNAAAMAACRNKGASAVTAGAEGVCNGRGYSAAVQQAAHGNCDACVDMARCDQELRSLGSVTQVVRLKNGVMFVHTASNPGDVRAVQAAIAHRNERLNAITVAGDKAHLCPACKAMRGAIASGKLTREMVTIEGGCLTLMTSGDPTMVTKLHAMAEPPATQTSARIKS